MTRDNWNWKVQRKYKPFTQEEEEPDDIEQEEEEPDDVDDDINDDVNDNYLDKRLIYRVSKTVPNQLY